MNAQQHRNPGHQLQAHHEFSVLIEDIASNETWITKWLCKVKLSVAILKESSWADMREEVEMWCKVSCAAQGLPGGFATQGKKRVGKGNRGIAFRMETCT
eukprot:1158821-Pelagomonas_calceolata.AAC.2